MQLRLKSSLCCYLLAAWWVGLGIPSSVEGQTEPSTDSPRPNVVVVLIDDLGWNDVGYNGSTFHDTPCLDAFAAESFRFDQAYAASSMCSPTRASIFTGKTPARHGITQYLRGWRSTNFRVITPLTGQAMDSEEVTIGQPFHQAGYVTAFMGKWHMGTGNPSLHGFDQTEAFIQSNRCAMHYPFRGGHFFDDAVEGDYFTDKITDQALEFLEEAHTENKPFMLYLAHFAMHSPISAPEEWRSHYQSLAEALPPLLPPDHQILEPYSHKPLNPRQDNPDYAGELRNLDTNIGRLIDYLKTSGLYDNTIVVLTADNGGRSTLEHFDNPTSVQPLRGGKTFLFEGGIRVPQIIHWPGVTQPGTSSSEPVISMDIYPTLLEMTGLASMPEQHVDGTSLVPLMQGEEIQRDSLFWHFPHYQGEGAYPASAIRMGNFKLIHNFHFDDDLLFNLEEDPHETTNLIEEHPEVAAQLREELDRWFVETGASLPVPNPRSDFTDDISERHRER